MYKILLLLAVVVSISACTFTFGDPVGESGCRTGFTMADFNGSIVYVDKDRNTIRQRFGEPARFFTKYDKQDGKTYDVESYKGTRQGYTTYYGERYDPALKRYKTVSYRELEEQCVWLWVYYEQGKDIVVKVQQGPQ